MCRSACRGRPGLRSSTRRRRRSGARLLCPRYLEPDTPYLACLVPSFEAGRLAGLGLSAPARLGGDLAWTAASGAACSCRSTTPGAFAPRRRAPTSRSWSGASTPIMLSPDVGVHALDLSDPGSTQPAQRPRWSWASKALWCRPWSSCRPGAIRTVSKFRRHLPICSPRPPPARRVAAGEAYDPSRHDPVVAPPALRRCCRPGSTTVPGTRRAARRGLRRAGCPRPTSIPGTARSPAWEREVVRTQPGAADGAGLGSGDRGVRRVNRVLGQTRLAREVGRRRHVRVLQLRRCERAAAQQRRPSAPESVAGVTVFGSLLASDLPQGTVSAAFRRQMRAGATVAARRSPRARERRHVTRRLTERIATEHVERCCAMPTSPCRTAPG